LPHRLALPLWRLRILETDACIATVSIASMVQRWALERS
jgi:hypothetical protein